MIGTGGGGGGGERITVTAGYAGGPGIVIIVKTLHKPSTDPPGDPWRVLY